MSKKIFNFVFVVLLSLFASCGGGGGGGGSSSSEGLRFFHGVLELPPLEVASGDGLSIINSNSKYAFLTDYNPVSEGLQSFLLRRSGENTSVASQASATINSGSAYTLLLFGSRSLGINSRVILDDLPEFEDSNAGGLRVVHALIGAQALRLRVNGALVGSESSFGFASSYVPFASGDYAVQIERVVDGTPVWSGTVSVSSGRGSSLYVTGRVGSLVVVRQ